MADLTVTAANVKLLKPDEAVVTIEVLDAATTAGTPVYLHASNGDAIAADANGSGTENAIGIVLADARTGANGTFPAGATVNVLRQGLVGGFDLSGMDYNEIAYVSDTVGRIADAAGTRTVRIGRVVGVWEQGDSTPTKYLYIDRNTPADVSA